MTYGKRNGAFYKLFIGVLRKYGAKPFHILVLNINIAMLIAFVGIRKRLMNIPGANYQDYGFVQNAFYAVGITDARARKRVRDLPERHNVFRFVRHNYHGSIRRILDWFAVVIYHKHPFYKSKKSYRFLVKYSLYQNNKIVNFNNEKAVILPFFCFKMLFRK